MRARACFRNVRAAESRDENYTFYSFPHIYTNIMFVVAILAVAIWCNSTINISKYGISWGVFMENDGEMRARHRMH